MKTAHKGQGKAVIDISLLEESLYIEVWRCQNAGGTNQIAAVAQL